MRRYETIFISHPELSEEGLEELTQQKAGALAKSRGEVIQIDQWGKKRLAYPIRKNQHGYYTLLDYAAEPEAVTELERVLRLDDMVIKYLTVKLDDEVDLEAVKRSVAQAKAAAVARDAVAEEETTEAGDVEAASGETGEPDIPSEAETESSGMGVEPAPEPKAAPEEDASPPDQSESATSGRSRSKREGAESETSQSEKLTDTDENQSG